MICNGKRKSMEEKKYINLVLNYCETYIEENVDTLNYFENMLNTIMCEENLLGLENPNKVVDTLHRVIEIYKEYKDFLLKHKENLETLKNATKDLESPIGLEIIKDTYINNISIDIENIYKFIHLINLYIDVFENLKRNVPCDDINVIQKLVERLENINDMSIYEMENLKKGEDGIIKLETKLKKIKNVLEQESANF